MQQDTLLLCPNAIVNITNKKVRKRKMLNFGMVKRLVLPLNVGKENGQSFIGRMNKSGNHWALVVVEIRPVKRILYCDTLAWKHPSDIIDVVNSYIIVLESIMIRISCWLTTPCLRLGSVICVTADATTIHYRHALMYVESLF